MYEFDSRVRYSEVDHHGTMTVPALINYFQDCSTFQSEAIGEGVAELKKRGCAWVLSAWQIHVRRYPSLGEAVKITTWASGFKGFLGMRNFMMETEDGEMLACANSIWSYVNMETGNIADSAFLPGESYLFQVVDAGASLRNTVFHQVFQKIRGKVRML